MRSGLSRFAALGVAGALLLAGCGDEAEPTTSKIFQGPVWDGPERANYDVLYENGDLYGSCQLETEPNGETTTVYRLCSDAEGEGHRDDGMAIVDSETLTPIESERVQVDMESRMERTMTGTYSDELALLTRLDVSLDDPTDVDVDLETERELPQPDEGSPNPGFYDDETLYWLMRGIPLEEDWEGAYHNIHLGTARIVVAEVAVEGQETIEVPAGEFETWRVQLRTASVTQHFWVDVAAPHRVIQADIERVRYALRSFE